MLSPDCKETFWLPTLFENNSSTRAGACPVGSCTHFSSPCSTSSLNFKFAILPSTSRLRSKFIRPAPFKNLLSSADINSPSLPKVRS